MSEATRARMALVGIMIFAGVVFCLGIQWGLPSRTSDRYLFGDHPAWTGQQIVALLPVKDRNLGADVDVNPIVDRSRAVVLNETDAQRAEIIRRYRLFTYQPDEMITMMALGGMRPGE